MSQSNPDEEHLAYGEYHGEPVESERGVFRHVFGHMKSKNSQATSSNPSQSQSSTQEPKSSGMSFLFDKVHASISEIKDKISGEGIFHSHTHTSGRCSDGTHAQNMHRFQSFAPQRTGNDAKWFVDGCSYMWAVSEALEHARESVWILDWWLSPELYLRRPPAQNEEYRIDRMLQRAAERGVKVNILVYKEVTQALTRKYLNPDLPNYLHSLLPRQTDQVTRALTRFGLDVTFKSLEELERTYPLIEPPISVSSAHTKHALEALHPNIAVFRHPDHLPDRKTLASSFLASFQGKKMTAATASKLPGDALKAIYGMNEDTVLYWAHHEKLCLIDGDVAFMGGLDLCYGRWDTWQHAIADAHPGNLDRIVFPGQDFNNARVYDFADVSNWQNNKLDRRYNSRMGWSDVSICLSGPVVEDLKSHFAGRWNFIMDEKYFSREDDRYKLIDYKHSHVGIIGHGLHQGQTVAGAETEPPQPERLRDRLRERFEEGAGQLADEKENLRERLGVGQYHGSFTGTIPCQIVRSCTKWSAGLPLEHSIADAYINLIRESRHFIYIENQFFITATSDKQSPIKNKIGAALAERIIRAGKNEEDFKIFVIMPSVPAFAGDLKNDDSLGTRAIMEFQYDSINRGGHSIMETVAQAGINPVQYIRFFNLRNYDRINSSGAMEAAEQQSGINYNQAQQGFDQRYATSTQEAGTSEHQKQQFDQFQQASQQIGDHKGLGSSGRWDSVAECYMLGGEDIRNVPWEAGNVDELDAFVSEELYVHSKIMIVDDRHVICGSANMNDRSQLGSHDSEIAIVVEDPTEFDSTMAGRPYRATRFAASLRRHLFRKHLGLVRPQDYTSPDNNYHPIGTPNKYDWGSHEDRLVEDPLSNEFQSLWNNTARTNTEAFEKVFHPVPTDKVRTWKQYDEYYERFFKESKDAKQEAGKDPAKPSTWKWGHVVAEEFPGGVNEVKEVLSRIRGTLVEMPLLFLNQEDIAKEGLGLNPLTEDVYT